MKCIKCNREPQYAEGFIVLEKDKHICADCHNVDNEPKVFIGKYWDGDKEDWGAVVARNAKEAKEVLLDDLCNIMDIPKDERPDAPFEVDEMYKFDEWGNYKIKVVPK